MDNTKDSANKQIRAYACPASGAPLDLVGSGLINKEGVLFEFIGGNPRVIDFRKLSNSSDFDLTAVEAYDNDSSIETYENFVEWLCNTFGIKEIDFREEAVDRMNLSKGMKVLIVGCGLGSDIPIVRDKVGTQGEIYAQDLSERMVIEAAKRNKEACFSISNALFLPYRSRYFDVVFHFGGINVFGDVRRAIGEMERVCKLGGRVLFGDEGIAEHLRQTQYAGIAIANNELWSCRPPLDLLPHNSRNIQLNYVLGNCFYLIEFTPAEGLPYMNIDVPHKGLRGGTMRTRYFGTIEGVSQETRNRLYSTARQRNVSVHDLLEDIINASI